MRREGEEREIGRQSMCERRREREIERERERRKEGEIEKEKVGRGMSDGL